MKKADLFISHCKQNLLSPDDRLPLPADNGADGDLSAVYKNYRQLCSREKAVDLEDMIFMAVALLQTDSRVYETVLQSYPYLFVDEYQDLNFGQYVLTKLLAKDNHILVIGDPDQSIYGFRGSDNRFFTQFETDFPGSERIFLTRNYRSTQTILDASFQMISKSEQPAGDARVFSGIGGAAQLIIKQAATETAEAVAIGKMIEKLVGGTSFFSMDTGKAGLEPQKDYSFADFAVLYRTTRQCDTFIKIFEKEGIPFQTADKKRVFEIGGIRQLISLCRIIGNCATFHDAAIVFDHFGVNLKNKSLAGVEDGWIKKEGRIWDESGRAFLGGHSGIPEKAKEKLINALETVRLLTRQVASKDLPDALVWLCENTGLKETIAANASASQAWDTIMNRARLHNDWPSYLASLSLDRDTDALGVDAEKVSLMTLHAAKGLEFPVVFVTGCETGLIPFARDGRTVDDPEEERRLFYVGMTRAMDILCLTYALKRRIYGTQVKRQRSVFIDDIEKRLVRLEKRSPKAPVEKKETQLELF